MSVYLKEPKLQAEACVIWMHGLGADGSDMAGLAEQLLVGELALRHVFLDAPVRPVTLNGGLAMRAWYDILGTELTDREDEKGIMASETLIRQAFDEQLRRGLPGDKIFLAGFSQGGAMALYSALHRETPVGGVIALSAYLPLVGRCKTKLAKETPIFMASGVHDPIVLPFWTRQSVEWLSRAGYNKIAFHNYSMEHSICLEEILDLSTWLRAQIKGEA